MRTPNPLPCGCRASLSQETLMFPGTWHVIHCPMHAAAADLLAALKQIQETCESDIRQGIVPDNCIVWQIEADARAAIAKAEPTAADTRS